MGTLRLGVNIDHVATLRQARYATMPESKNCEPDPIAIAGICERTGRTGSLRICARTGDTFRIAISNACAKRS